MAIKRYYANADNTITNAYKEDFNTRGTGSNTGQSDILEVFSLYAQRDSSSDEASRILIQFPIGDLSSDRTNGDLPASGSVSFYLKLYNAEHSRTLPRDFYLTVAGASGSWEEGTGLDMENYTDITYDVTGSNWNKRGGNVASATLVDAINVAGVAQNDKFTMTVPTSAGGDGVTYTFLFDSGTDVEANEEANTFGISLTSVSDEADTAAVLIKAINGTADNKYKYGAANLGAGSALAAGTIGLTAAIGSSTTKITLTMDTKGSACHVANVLAAVTGFENDLLLEDSFTGGDGPWTAAGGDWYTDASSSFTQRFEEGTEDLDVNVTTLVEQWINSGGNVLGEKENNGFIIKLSASYEARSTYNPTGSLRSYYTKKFFARSSEHFFDRPVLEARWDSSRRDNRGNIYFSSSLAPASDNLNTLYLYNYIRGNLKDIGGASSEVPVLNLYYASGSFPEGSAQFFRNSSHAEVNHLSATRASTGVYKATFSVSSSVVSNVYPYLVDVWTYSGSQVHTGSSFWPKKYDFSDYNPNSNYVISMPNLKQSYRRGQTERFRLYVRNKNWSPSIYTKATEEIETLLIESASYEIIRMSDHRVVVPYGTGSDGQTVMSYDKSGSYFDLDVNLLESGYTYGIKYAFYEDSVSSYREQPNLFKFRVDGDFHLFSELSNNSGEVS